MMNLNSQPARELLIAYVSEHSNLAERVFGALCAVRLRVDVNDLLRLETMTREDHWRRIALINQLLTQEQRFPVEPFLSDLEDDFVYMGFRDHASADVIALLHTHAGRLKGKARIHARMLFVLAEKDPIPGLLAMLEDESWKDKNLALSELARLKDPRAVAPIARILTAAPLDYFSGSEAHPSTAVEHALEAIAWTAVNRFSHFTAANKAINFYGSIDSGEPAGKPRQIDGKASIVALIDLLDVNLGRFGEYIDQKGF